MSLVSQLSAQIAAGRFPAGHYMPAERKVAAENGVALMTARRALKLLEREGLVAAEPRRGYRVLAGAGDPDRGLPIGYLARDSGAANGFWDDFHKALLAAFQRAASGRGWSLLAVGANGDEAERAVSQLRAARVCGAIIDHPNQQLFSLLKRERLPVVLVDCWMEDLSVDSVNQDGFIGGLKAASYLAQRGHRTIAYFGAEPLPRDLQIWERYTGAMAGLEREGCRLDPELRVEAPLGNARAQREAARRLLQGPKRPSAILTLWQEMTAALVDEARLLGLVPGRDFDMVGWANEEFYQSAYRPLFAGGPVPPAVVWSISEMADAAVSLLKQRRAEPDAKPRQLRIPVRLRTDPVHPDGSEQ